jgi:serine/threonine protein kinase
VSRGGSPRRSQALQSLLLISLRTNLWRSRSLMTQSSKKERNLLNSLRTVFISINHYLDIRKHNELPPTTLDYYKYLKLVGKGAFGKVTLGLHKLTGKQVAIKTIEKSYMKDDFSRRKVF